jgi:DNA-binding NarL/FixJ family response regulator
MQLVLADPQTLVRAGIRRLIEAVPGMRVVGEAGDGQQLLQEVGRLHPDAVLTEISLPVMSGLEAMTQIRRHYPQVRVMILSAQASHHNVRSAMRLGAAGFLVKDAEPAELELALSALRKQQTYLSPRVAQTALERRNSAERGDGAALTVRQRQVLALMARGKSTKEIAALMGVSIKTVETHRARTMQSLGLHGVNALMRYALSSGLESAGA